VLALVAKGTAIQGGRGLHGQVCFVQKSNTVTRGHGCGLSRIAMLAQSV
jgi:hypothetical protein